MAYHLQSLVRVIELILNHDTHKYFDNNTTPQIESLLRKACFLRDSFENHPILSDDSAANLEDQVRDATQDAEDVLESYVAFFATEDALPTPNLHELLETFDSMNEEIMKILDKHQISSQTTMHVVSSRIDHQNPSNMVVGFESDMLKLMDRVFADSSKLEIIPIVGMGGIGKTTLAREIYGESSDFDVRAWATVSNGYSLCDILLDLLCSIIKKPRDEIEMKDNKLGLTLYQRLKGKKYMIVLDDIWHFKAWDDIKAFLPNDNVESRIVLTTRQSDVATYADSKSLHHQLHPLGKADSLALLKKKVFGEETCPPELEELGRTIANSCGGLPLAILVVGGILSQTDRTKNSWEQVASNLISAIANEEEQVSRILSLSYDHLPCYLKFCFLYMSVFPEDHHIIASKLIRLWLAEGFLKQIADKSIEEVAGVAEGHINALITRNLIFVRHRDPLGKVKTLGIHDLLRDLCVLKAHKKNFFHVVDGRIENIPGEMLCMRRVSVVQFSHIQSLYYTTGETLLARSLVYTGPRFREPWEPSFSLLKMLRVLDVLLIQFQEFPEVVLKLGNLRYLALTFLDTEIPRSIITLRNLQTLSFKTTRRGRNIKVSDEIFDMPHLREILSPKTVLSSEEYNEGSENLVLQKNLHSLPLIEILANLDAVLTKLPNLKKLGLFYSNASPYSTSSAEFITYLPELETLLFSSVASPEATSFLSNLVLPLSLKKLTLRRCEASEACLKTISRLPNLEILKLEQVSFGSTKNWNPSEGEFSSLQCLKLEGLDLVDWAADETHFPILQHLEIQYCKNLNEIPSCIGEIPTLKTIWVFNSSPSAAASATKILEEQIEYGNVLLQVHVDGCE